MGLLDNLGDLLKQATSGNASPGEVNATYDQVARTVPQSDIADALTHAFNSDKTPPFEEMLSKIFSSSNPDQKAGILNRILGSLGPGGIGQVLGSAGGLGGLAGVLNGNSVTPQQAQQVSPEDVQVLAQHAAKKDPSIVDAASAFYAQHPGLVKAIGAGALALLMSKISQSRR